MKCLNLHPNGRKCRTLRVLDCKNCKSKITDKSKYLEMLHQMLSYNKNDQAKRDIKKQIEDVRRIISDEKQLRVSNK